MDIFRSGLTCGDSGEHSVQPGLRFKQVLPLGEVPSPRLHAPGPVQDVLDELEVEAAAARRDGAAAPVVIR